MKETEVKEENVNNKNDQKNYEKVKTTPTKKANSAINNNN